MDKFLLHTQALALIHRERNADASQDFLFVVADVDECFEPISLLIFHTILRSFIQSSDLGFAGAGLPAGALRKRPLLRQNARGWGISLAAQAGGAEAGVPLACPGGRWDRSGA